MTRPYRRRASYDVAARDTWSTRAHWLHRLATDGSVDRYGCLARPAVDPDTLRRIDPDPPEVRRLARLGDICRAAPEWRRRTTAAPASARTGAGAAGSR